MPTPSPLPIYAHARARALAHIRAHTHTHATGRPIGLPIQGSQPIHESRVGPREPGNVGLGGVPRLQGGGEAGRVASRIGAVVAGVGWGGDPGAPQPGGCPHIHELARDVEGLARIKRG